MAFSLTTRALLLAAIALATISQPTHAVDFATADTAASGAGTVSATTAPAATAAAAAAATTVAPAAEDDTAPVTTKPVATTAAVTTKPAAGTTTATTAPTTATSGSSETTAATTPAASGSLPKDITKTVDGWPAPIVIKGNRFFNSKTGLEFRQRGMAYYPRPNGGELANVNNYDWAADEHEAIWRPHLAIMQDLGVNTIRLYSVDPGKSHDKFMCACAEAGIYVLIGMAAPCENCSIQDLAPPKCYPDALFARMQVVYNAFAVYDNVLGFSVANENNLLNTGAKTKDGIQTMPCVKALLRDTRNYAASCSGMIREVPIGLDLADILPREQWLEYMDCAIDNNEYSRAQWIGFNPYVECDPTTHTTYAQSAGLQNLMAVYKKIMYPRPLMFGEFGCNLGKNTVDGYENQRTFYDAKWMNEEADMTEEIVGGNVFEFVTEIPNTVARKLTKTADDGRFGVGFLSPDNCDHDKIPCVFTPYPEYANLKKAYTTTKASTLKMADYTVERSTVLTCPTNISSTLQPMPTSVAPLSCGNQQPVCSGAKSNSAPKSTAKVPALGEKAKPSNTDTPGASANGTTSAAVSANAYVAAAATVLYVVASVVLV